MKMISSTSITSMNGVTLISWTSVELVVAVIAGARHGAHSAAAQRRAR